MTAAVFGLLMLASGSAAPTGATADTQKYTSAKEALQPFNFLIGSWKGTGYPEGTKEEKAAGLWTESVTWAWQFKGDDAWLTATFGKGKHSAKWELHYSVEKQAYQLAVTGADKSTQNYTGTLKDKALSLDRVGGPAGEDRRLVVSLLHHNRYLYRLETKASGSPLGFVKQYQVGATKEGVPFAEVAKGPECIVSGGVGTMKVSYKGKDYYVCCSGCRDAFKDDPEKYIKEAEKAKDKEKK